MNDFVFSPNGNIQYRLVRTSDGGRRYYVDEKGRKYTREGTQTGKTMAVEEGEA